MQTVLLINKAVGGSHRIYPVSGASGKLYGNALLGNLACPEFRMSLADYDAAKFDIIGNMRAGQQWIPQFEATFESATVDEVSRLRDRVAELEAQAESDVLIIHKLRAQIPAPPDPLLGTHINELRALAKKVGVDTTGGKQQLVAAIRAQETKTALTALTQ